MAWGERLTCHRQQFERGFLVWCDRLHGKYRSGDRPNMVFAIEEGGGNRAWYVEDTWTEAEGLTPCTWDLPNLKGALRKVWCEQKEIREALRLPTEEAWALYRVELKDYATGPGVMEFEGGYIVWDTFTSRLWVLIGDFGWKSLAIGPGTVTPSPTSTPTPTPPETGTPSPTETMTTLPTGTVEPLPSETPALLSTPLPSASVTP